MSLKKRIIIYFSLLIFLATCAMLYFSLTAIKHNSSILETKVTFSQLQRIKNEIEYNLDSIEQTSYAIGVSKGLSEYLKTKDKSFIHERLSANDMQNHKINLVLILDMNKEIIFGNCYRNEIGFTEGIKDCIKGGILHIKPLLYHEDIHMVTRGLYIINNKPVQLVSRYIFKDETSNIPEGHLILGRVIDGYYLSELTNRTKMGLTFYMIQENMDAEWAGVADRLSGHYCMTFDRISDQEIYGYIRLNNLDNEAALIFRTFVPRIVYPKSRNSMLIQTIVVISFGILLMGFTIWIFQYWILSRLNAIIGKMKVVMSGDVSERFSCAGNDEITKVQKAMDEMLDVIEDKENELLEMNKSLESRVSKEIGMRIRNEDLLIQQAKMATIGEMMELIAHQWKQPISNISLIAGCLPNLDKTTMKEEVGNLMQQVKYMKSTMDTFRNFFMPSRFTEVFSLKEAMAEVIMLMKPALEMAEIELTMEFPDYTTKRQCTISGMQNEFKQVVINIIINAKDAIMKEQSNKRKNGERFNGKITIIGRVEENEIIICLTDNGGGIKPEIIDHIFEANTTTKENGSGIGMYMAKLILEDKMNGHISAKNINSGAEFQITLPPS